MKTVKGKWKFNDILTSASSVSQEVNFTSDGKNYISIRSSYDVAPVYSLGYGYIDADDDFVEDDAYYFEESPEYEIEIGWGYEAYKTIDFGKAEQEVSDWFYDWLVENATYIGNTIINITQNGTTTLATAGKYCDRNIDVNVTVPDADSLAQGTISGEYVSDKITSLRGFAFESCKSLTGVSFPNCKSVGNICFRNCTALESANLPSCEKFSGSSQFDGAVKLKSINVPNLTTIESGQRAFINCGVLEEFNAPNLTSLKNTAAMFNSCGSLRKVSFPKLGGTTINANTFNWCSHLSTLILGGNELNPLENVNAFGNAGIYSGGFTVYVPDNLVNTYKTATNWSTFADQIKPISELEE